MAHTLSHLEALPNEVILEILTFLDPPDISKLQGLSSRLLKICRDDLSWRKKCYDWVVTNSHGPLPLAVRLLSGSNQSGIARERVRIAANWDPTFPGERINWYTEYIQRHGPVQVNWLDQPCVQDGSHKEAVDVIGAATYQPRQDVNELFAVSPLDDGSVCIWDIKGTRLKVGSRLQTTRPGLLGRHSTKGARTTMRISDCVSVDNIRHRAYFAVENYLTEVDLLNLQVVSSIPFAGTITALSAADPTVPLTVGTLHGIHLHDWRIAPVDGRVHNERVDASYQLDQINRWNLGSRPRFAALTEPSPLSILHLEQPGTKDISEDIFVAGRFASILHYDRRMFPTIKQSIHSGSSLCGLASLPYPFSCVDSELRRRGELSLAQVRRAKDLQGGRTLIACGEYNTRGALELYGLRGQSYPDSTHGVIPNSTLKNRHTAAGAKVLSVITQGTRIAFSDGQGNIKWVERDGFTEVRHHSIGNAETPQESSLFADSCSDEIARKLLSTRTSDTDYEYGANNDDILFWTGDKLGLVNFGSTCFSVEDFKERGSKTPEELAREKQQEEYSRHMRLMLEEGANEARLSLRLGLGISSAM